MSTNLKRTFDFDYSALDIDSNWEIGIVVSEWNFDITENLFKGAKEQLLKIGIKKEKICRVNVPGSFELIFGAKTLVKTSKYKAVIVIGSLIKGETDHFHYVANATSLGIKDLNVSYGTPTIFCVLTDNTLQQAKDRSGGKYGNKGSEAAIAAIKMITLANNKTSC